MKGGTFLLGNRSLRTSKQGHPSVRNSLNLDSNPFLKNNVSQIKIFKTLNSLKIWNPTPCLSTCVPERNLISSLELGLEMQICWLTPRPMESETFGICQESVFLTSVHFPHNFLPVIFMHSKAWEIFLEACLFSHYYHQLKLIYYMLHSKHFGKT